MPEALDDIGDPRAPVGSPAWCKAKHTWLLSAKHRIECSVGNFGSSLLGMREAEYFRTLADRHGRPFPDFEAYCRELEPWGLGLTDHDLSAVLEEPDRARPLVSVLSRSAAGKLGGRGHKAPDENKELSAYGTARHYTVGRLRRDRPDLADRVERRELSANAAAIEAGFRRPRSAFSDLCAAWRRASGDDRARFEDWIAESRRREAA